MEQQHLIQRLVILDLTLKVLEKDRQLIPHFKLVYAFTDWFELKMNAVHDELIATRNELLKHDITLLTIEKTDKLFTTYSFRFKSGQKSFRYANHALRNWTNEEVKRLLQIPYRTPIDFSQNNKGVALK